MTMKNWQKFLALSSILMFTCSMIFAQAQIKGKVSDEDGNPLPGIRVIYQTAGSTSLKKRWIKMKRHVIKIFRI